MEDLLSGSRFPVRRLRPLVLMPLMLGMGLQFGMALAPPMLMSLVGHLIYGLLTGLVYVGYVSRT